MAGRLERLKTAGGVLGAASAVLTVAGANWGLLLSAAIALGAAFWKGAFSFFTDPHVRVFGSVFLWALWTYIALSILYRMRNGIKVIPHIDYAHAVLVESFGLALDRESENNALQIIMNLRNVSNGAIRITVEDYRIIIGNRTVPDCKLGEIIIPRVGNKGIMSGVFSKDVIKDRTEGTIDCTIHYGPAEGQMLRKFRVKSKIHLKLGDPAGMANEFVSEEDAPL
jgi:hypothetical protein